MATRDPLPLATLNNCFRLLCAQPGALTIDGHLLQNSLPSRPVPLDELGGRLKGLPQEAGQAVLAVMVARAQVGSPTWQVALAGLLLPGLQVLADRLPVTNRATAEAAALTWFRSTLALPAPTALRDLHWLLRIESGAGRQARDAEQEAGPLGASGGRAQGS